MPDPVPLATIDAIRAASRQLVRQLGFMGGKFAGTDLSLSAAHALIEIEAGKVTARDLTNRLCLEKSSVSRMLRKLVATGDVAETGSIDGRSKLLSLTDAGRKRTAAIHAFARNRVSLALAELAPGQDRAVLDGLHLYTAALTAAESAPANVRAIEIVSGYQTGLIARTTQMHAHRYAGNSGFALQFEAFVAGGLSEFCGRLGAPSNAIWAAMRGREIVGSIAIDGDDLGGGVAHLRWFIVEDDTRGAGARGDDTGRKLLGAALAFVDACDFVETHLWTFGGLDAALHLYEERGFTLAEERAGSQWGADAPEQRFARRRPGA
jgi:DNA-binding MarR family transcriptional regulator